MKTIILLLVVLLGIGCVSVPPKRSLMTPPPGVIILDDNLLLARPMNGADSMELPDGSYRRTYENDAAIYYQTEKGQIRFRKTSVLVVKVGGICYQKKDGRFFAFLEVSDADHRENQRMVAPGIAAVDALTLPIRRRIYRDTDSVERAFQRWIFDEHINRWRME